MAPRLRMHGGYRCGGEGAASGAECHVVGEAADWTEWAWTGWWSGQGGMANCVMGPFGPPTFVRACRRGRHRSYRADHSRGVKAARTVTVACRPVR